MARSGVNKSECIRKYFETNPQASVKDCIEALSAGGVEVSYALVFGVRGRSTETKEPEPREISLSEIKLVRDFVDKSNLDPDLATKILNEFIHVVRGVGTIDRFEKVLVELDKFYKDSSSEVVPGVQVRDVLPGVDVISSYTDVNDDEDDDA